MIQKHNWGFWHICTITHDEVTLWHLHNILPTRVQCIIYPLYNTLLIPAQCYQPMCSALLIPAQYIINSCALLSTPTHTQYITDPWLVHYQQLRSTYVINTCPVYYWSLDSTLLTAVEYFINTDPVHYRHLYSCMLSAPLHYIINTCAVYWWSLRSA